MINTPEEIIIKPSIIDKTSWAKYLESSSKIDILFDQLIPRNNASNPCIVINKEEYLSRLSTLKRKYLATQYRFEVWTKVVIDHKKKFSDHINLINTKNNKSQSNNNSSTFSFSLRDLKIENEFEMFISTVVNTLNVLARYLSSFLKGSESCHSLSTIKKITNDEPGFKKLSKIISEAENEWIDKLKTRRNDATHYIMVSAHSKYSLDIVSSDIQENSIFIGIPQKPEKGKSISIWLEDIPVIGGQRDYSENVILSRENVEIEAHEIFDLLGRSIYRYNGNKIFDDDLIDGEVYISDINNYLETLICKILLLIQHKIKLV